MFNPDLHLLGLELAANGFAGRELAVGAVARAARQAHVSPVLADILVSTTDPEPARLRAFGRIANALSFGRATDVPVALAEPTSIRPAA
jgi:hypothetical protein